MVYDVVIDRGILSELKRIYGSFTETLFKLLKQPPRKLYARVNTIRAKRSGVIETLLSEGIEAYPDEYIEDAVYFNVEGPFELECKEDKRIIVNTSTAISLMLGANLYRPGVVKSNAFRRGEQLLAVSPTGIPVACIETIASSKEIMHQYKGLVGINVNSLYRAPRIAETKCYLEGLIYPQSAPSIIAVHVLKPRKGELIVDMNASPGGKTSHIIQLTRGNSRIIAIDRNENKIISLMKTLNSLKLEVGVLPVPVDSRYIHVDLNLENKANKVLIDPPCSNLGVRPLLDYSRTMRDVISLSNYQKQFLKAASIVLKPNGILVYSTCTLTRSENEDNIVYAVEELGLHSVELDEQPPYSEKISYKGIVGYRFSPLYRDMPGYFIAVLTK